jgi:tetratricopeptide (TPR) repeat protein
MTLGRPMAERPWLALQAGEPAAAYEGFQPVIQELDQLQFPDDDRLGGEIRSDYLSWALRSQGDAAIQLSRYAEAEALARRRIALPDAAFGDVVRERADREQQLGLALAKLGRSGEAREVLERALEHHRKRRAEGETGTEFRLSFAEALYAGAIAQENDAAGRRARQQMLEAATAELDGLSDEARQLHAARLFREWIAAARLM